MNQCILLAYFIAITLPKLRNGCSCASSMVEDVLQAFPELEIFNSQFTRNYGEWALGFCGGIYGKDNPGNDGEYQLQDITSLDLSNRCIHNLNNKVVAISL